MSEQAGVREPEVSRSMCLWITREIPLTMKGTTSNRRSLRSMHDNSSAG